MLLSLWASDQAMALRRHVEGHSPARQLVKRPAHRLMHLLKQRQDIRFRKKYSCAANVNLSSGTTFLHFVLCHAVRIKDVIEGLLCNLIDNSVFAFWHHLAMAEHGVMD